jgi:biotin transport system substrate-specific component
MTTRDLTVTALFAGLTAACAQVSLSLPLVTAVPFTLQVFAVLVSGAILGARRGFLSQCVYLLLGAVGLPVFARMYGGLGVLLGPTGGYLWSYPLAALAVGWSVDRAPRTAAKRPLTWSVYGGMVLGIAIIYALGAAGLYASNAVPSLAAAFRVGVLPFVAFDLLKAYVAVLVAVRVRGVVVPAQRVPV